MSEECTHDCGSCGKSCGDREGGQPQSMLESPHELTHVKKIIGIVSGKGGVGKSLVTSMLAVLTRRAGYSVGILDADITGPSIPTAFGIRDKAQGNEYGILPSLTKTGIELMSLNLLIEDAADPVVWRGPVIAGTVKQFWTDVLWGDLDFLFIDMPPGTGDVPLTVFQSIPVDGILVVASPQELVSMIVEKAVRMADMMEIPVLGLVENMSYFQCPDCGGVHHIFGESHIDEIAKNHQIKMVCRLPINPKLAAAVDAGTIELLGETGLDPMAAMLEKLLQ